TQAHDRNMEYMMLLGIFPAGSLQLPYSVDGSNTAFWTAWFSAYQAIVVEYAAIARDLHIEYISLGLNSGLMSAQSVTYWQTLIKAIRATGYTGKLVYQSYTNFSAYGDGEHADFNGGCCGNVDERPAKRLEFVKLFDAIVLDVNAMADTST